MKTFARFAIFTFLLTFLTLPVLVSAQSANKPLALPYWGPLLSCTGNDPSVTKIDSGGLQTCHSICDLLSTAQRIMYFAITISLFILAPIMFLWGGIMIMISAGSAEKVGAANKMLMSTVVGVLIVLFAFVIVNTFFFFTSKFFGSANVPQNWSSISCSV
jgi:hypothetical protein